MLLSPKCLFANLQNEFVKEKTEKLGGKINVESSLKTFYKEVKNVGDFSCGIDSCKQAKLNANCQFSMTKLRSFVYQ